MPRRWTITTHVTGKPRRVDVVLYNRVGDLRRAASRFARVIGEKPGRFNDALGVCHGFNRFTINADGTESEDDLVGIIRLTATDLTPLIISHEIAHAAQHIYGLDYSDDRPVIDHMHSGNEDFAHLYGELFAAAWGVLGSAIGADA